MMLPILFTVHAIITFAAGAVLVAWPGAIPRMVGIQIEPNAYLLCYLLAAMEFGVAALSWGARTITDAKALRVIVIAFIVLHAASGCWRSMPLLAASVVQSGPMSRFGPSSLHCSPIMASTSPRAVMARVSGEV